MRTYRTKLKIGRDKDVGTVQAIRTHPQPERRGKRIWDVSEEMIAI